MPSQPRTRPSRGRIAALCVVGAVLLAGGWLLWRRVDPGRPENMQAQVFRALANRDAAALCRLADPEEVSRLNLTPQNVAAVLRETLYRQGPVRWQKIHHYKADIPPDRSEWIGMRAGVAPEERAFGVTLIDDPKRGWKLCLSSLLHLACRFRSPKRLRHVYIALAREHGIRGIRETGGTYYTLEEMELVMAGRMRFEH